jgi:hypothetical protein
MASKPEVGERVRLRGDHPWAGYSGTVARFEAVSGVRAPIVRLDNGMEVFVFEASQWARANG